MVKKLGENNKPIEPKPKAVRRRYVRKLNQALPKLDVQDFLPKLKGKTATDLKREVMKIRETLESEYQELKKKVTERKQKALEALSSKSTETLKKEQITKEKADAIELEKQRKAVIVDVKKSVQRVGELKRALESSSNQSGVAMQDLIAYLESIETPRQILERSDDYKEATKGMKTNLFNRIKKVDEDVDVQKQWARAFITASPDVRRENLEEGRPLKLKLAKETKATRAADGSKKLTEYKGFFERTPTSGDKPTLAMANPLETGSDDEGKAAGFKKLKKHVKEHHNIALIGKEDQMRMGEMSISVARDIRQLNELKRNHRGVVIRRSDLIDAERPINYELSIM